MENIFSEGFPNKKKAKTVEGSSGGSGGGGGETDNQACRRRSRSAHSSSGSSSSSSSRMRGNRSSRMVCASHGSVSVCGRRREMEDTVTIEPGFVQSSQTAEIESENFDFYAVYDGHGGSRVAQFCKDRLHQILADEIHEMMSAGEGEGGVEEEVVVVEEGIWERVMKSCFLKIDEEIDQSGVEEEVVSTTMKTIGSTAVVAVVSKEKLVVANCGDSRAVLCRGGVAVPLSVDHKVGLEYDSVEYKSDNVAKLVKQHPNTCLRPDELERVEAAGGRVIYWFGYRVLGELATSRSIGDHYLKPYVISEPEVILMERTTNDEFLILASDGLWDVMSNEIACDVVRKCLDGRIVRRLSTNVEGNNASEAAAVLVELAIARGSKDNISVIIVELNQSNRNLII